MPKIVFANALAKKQGFSLIALNVLHTGLSSATAYIPLLKSAALDFFRDHPITGLYRDCPVELKASIA